MSDEVQAHSAPQDEDAPRAGQPESPNAPTPTDEVVAHSAAGGEDIRPVPSTAPAPDQLEEAPWGW